MARTVGPDQPARGEKCKCNICSQHRAEHREPLLTSPVQERPWQRVSTDLFFWEKDTYLLIVDYFSRYIEVAHLNIASANTVIVALKDVFSHHGIPETVMSDNGSQYNTGSHISPAAQDTPRQTVCSGCSKRTVERRRRETKGFDDISSHTTGKWFLPCTTPHGETAANNHTTTHHNPAPPMAEH